MATCRAWHRAPGPASLPTRPGASRSHLDELGERAARTGHPLTPDDPLDPRSATDLVDHRGPTFTLRKDDLRDVRAVEAVFESVPARLAGHEEGARDVRARSRRHQRRDGGKLRHPFLSQQPVLAHAHLAAPEPDAGGRAAP